MATLEIDGRIVTVDDRFLQLSPEAQQARVNEIAASLNPGKYQRATMFDAAAAPKKPSRRLVGEPL
jgi:hypothetical protein